MSQMAQKISQVDHAELLKNLNIAFAEEWLAYYQYWLGSKLAVGPMRPAVAAEFLEHAQEELAHADKLANRIIELGGTPVLTPQDWQTTALCKYDAPSEPYVVNLLEQNLASERCAISRYQKICEMTSGKDLITYKLALSILQDETSHETELGAYQDDIAATFAHRDHQKL